MYRFLYIIDIYCLLLTFIYEHFIAHFSFFYYKRKQNGLNVI